ncbi:MAG: hypothetical protein ACRDCN_16010 [Tannerellaceae bacterium]
MKRISIISLIVLAVYSVLIYAFVMPEASHNAPFEFSYTLESPGVQANVYFQSYKRF